VVTADEGGVAHHDAIAPDRVVDVTGAGDALVAGVVLGELSGGRIPPLRWGLAAASLAVEGRGAAPPDLDPGRLVERLART
jgi:sugar/nucleoside kinase (ribokinase family)